MKNVLRNFLINLMAFWATTQILPGLVLDGGIQALFIVTLAMMLSHVIVIPLLKLMFLPLNLLTLGIFTWVVNVIALYILTIIIPHVKLIPFSYPGANINGFIIPGIDFNVWQVAILASFLVGLAAHFMKWLIK